MLNFPLQGGLLNVTRTVEAPTEFVLATNVNSSFEHPTFVPLAREAAN